MSRASVSRIRQCRLFLLIVGLLSAVAVLTACGPSTDVSTLAQNQRILASCDRTHPPATWVDIDGTGSSAGNYIFAERMAALQSIVQQTAVCGGYLDVVVFTSASVATTTLFDGSMLQPGATSNARLRHVPAAVTSVMATVRRAYGPAVASLDPDHSDITGQYTNAAQWFRQLGGAYQLHLILLSDGGQTVGIDLYTQVLDQQQATALAKQEPPTVPLLPGAEIVVAGIGRQVGPALPTPLVEGMRDYYTALCHRMEAATCLSVSNYQQAGW